MPRTVPAGFTAAFNSGGTGHLSPIFTITRLSGEVTRFTRAQRPFAHPNGHSYVPGPSIQVGALTLRANEAAGSLPLNFVAKPDGLIDYSDLINGAYDGAELLYDIVDHANPSNGVMRIFRGWLGNISIGGRSGTASCEARGLLSRTRFLVTEHYTPVCRAYLGDHRCKVPIYPDDVTRSTAYALGQYVRARQGSAGTPDDYGNLIWRCTTAGTTSDTAPAYAGIAGATETDGTAVFTAEDSYIRHAQVVSASGFDVVLKNVGTPRIAFDVGVILSMSGKNKGRAIEIKTWTQASLTANCFLKPQQAFAADDWVELIPGCDYTPGALGCAKYDNMLNSRMHNLVPGEDVTNADYRTWGS